MRPDRLARLEQRAPLRVLFPRVAADELVEAVLLNTGGGIVGGDRLAAEAGPGAQVRVTLRRPRRCTAAPGNPAFAPEMSCGSLPWTGSNFAVHPREALCAA